MARIFVVLILFYIFAVVLFFIVGLSLVFIRAKSFKYFLKSFLIFACFPILYLTQEGRQKLKSITNNLNNE